jgi:hypothetical protein
MPMSSENILTILQKLQDGLSADEFGAIQYMVIQSGTSLKDGVNTGTFSHDNLIKMTQICKQFGKLSKEHNGDFITSSDIKEKFENGLDSINIAPEFGTIESEILYNKLDKFDIDYVYLKCIESNRWQKWVSNNFQISNKKEMIKLCGHYVFNDIKNITYNLSNELDKDVYSAISTKINGILK